MNQDWAKYAIGAAFAAAALFLFSVSGTWGALIILANLVLTYGLIWHAARSGTRAAIKEARKPRRPVDKDQS